jgi:hypothetical protein
MCLRALEGLGPPTGTHGGLRACGGPGSRGGPPYVTPILRVRAGGQRAEAGAWTATESDDDRLMNRLDEEAEA